MMTLKPESNSNFIYVLNGKFGMLIMMTCILIMSICLSILSVIIFDQYGLNTFMDEVTEHTPSSAESDVEFRIDNMTKKFMYAVEGTKAFFKPIYLILLTVFLLKIVLFLLKSNNIDFRELFTIAFIAYVILFISDVFQMVFSISSGQILAYSIGTLPHYFEGFRGLGFPMSILANLNLFMLIFIGVLIFNINKEFNHRLLWPLGYFIYVVFVGIVSFV